MIRTGIFAGMALAAFCALPASAQIGLGGGGGAQLPGVGVGGGGSATIDTRPVTNTTRDTVDHARGSAHATVDTAKEKAAEAAARAKAAKPDLPRPAHRHQVR